MKSKLYLFQFSIDRVVFKTYYFIIVVRLKCSIRFNPLIFLMFFFWPHSYLSPRERDYGIKKIKGLRSSFF